MERAFISFMALISAIIGTGCNKIDGGRSQTGWSAPVEPASGITVSANGKDVENYTFEYKDNRLASLKRTDVLGSRDILDIKYAYNGSQLSIIGLMGNSRSGIEVNDSKKGLEYSGTATRAWTYHVEIGKDGLPSHTAASVNFTASSNNIASETSYEEAYTIQNGDICQTVAGNVIKGDSNLKTKTFSESALTTVYKYWDNEDRQNFNAFLMDCAFPVWFAKGLPGCRHLISDIEVYGGGLDYRSRQHIDYSFDEDGNILEATRTWYNGSEEYLRMTYRISY